MTVFCLASAFSTKTVQTKQNDYLLFNKALYSLNNSFFKRFSFTPANMVTVTSRFYVVAIE
ncbi:hypothetical protein DSJ_16775 [Pantoea stewartii subsp. stewartii DC283]|uniref:Uncharacterized protein n=1 Tax=Pantoea stewartii subsp. stewartii DC283 TaxID=660596 RepID=A0ABM6K9S9_PANSE|nr:hypothetical protein DSJ_16775 [Pantoea stewartii subsp. stewartii DC283]